MQRNGWIYIVSSLVIIVIGVLTLLNEKANTIARETARKEQVKKDSILENISIGIDALQTEVRSVEGKCDSAITIIQSQIRKDSIMQEELDLLKDKVRKCQKQTKK